MSQLSAFNRAQRTIRGWRYIPDAFWLQHLLSHNFLPRDYSLDTSKRLVIPQVAQHVPKRLAGRIAPWVGLIRKMAAHGAIFDFCDEATPTVSANGIKMKIEGLGELVTFYFVVVKQSYRMTMRQPTVVIDIGMNVGLASLYFASQRNVLAVYGYEPFEPTFRSALTNFALNPELSGKIAPLNAGVDSHAHTAKAGYCAEINDSLGVHGMVRDPGDAKIEMLTIELQSAADVFNAVRSKHPDAAILVKMDCEGSEREIVPALCSLPAIRDRVAMNIETHCGCEDVVMAALEDADFKVFAAETDSMGQWLMQAVSGIDW